MCACCARRVPRVRAACARAQLAGPVGWRRVPTVSLRAVGEHDGWDAEPAVAVHQPDGARLWFGTVPVQHRHLLARVHPPQHGPRFRHAPARRRRRRCGGGVRLDVLCRPEGEGQSEDQRKGHRRRSVAVKEPSEPESEVAVAGTAKLCVYAVGVTGVWPSQNTEHKHSSLCPAPHH